MTKSASKAIGEPSHQSISQRSVSGGTPWNKGRIVGAKLALKPKHIWALRFHLEQQKRVRELALLDVAIDSKLRGCDVVKLLIGDLVADGQPRRRATVI